MLLVDRESDDMRALSTFLRRHELEVVWVHDGESAYNVLDERRVDCLVTELKAPRIDGMGLLARARERNPEVCAVVIATAPAIEMAVEAMRRGAYDFQVKPLHFEKLVTVLERGLSHQALVARVAEIEGRLDDRLGFERLSGGSRAIQRVMEQVRAAASTRAPVLIEGENGTGKGLVAQAIHQNGPRREGPFITLNFRALLDDLEAPDLFDFGVVLTGDTERRGVLESATGGTLFIEEIADMTSSAQAQLLRALQTGAFHRVGGSTSIKLDTRLVAATSRDLAADVKAGVFHEDLFHRLAVVRVQMPPLRERREDIPLLVEAFLHESNRLHGRRVTGITRGALDRLIAHAWPGNVRELRNAIDGMVVFAEGKRALDFSDLPPAFREPTTEAPSLAVGVGMTVEEVEGLLITATLAHTGNDKPRAAAMLGIGLRTLYRKIKQYGIH